MQRKMIILIVFSHNVTNYDLVKLSQSRSHPKYTSIYVLYLP